MTRFIELAGEVNSGMPAYVVHRLGDALNARGKALNGSRILVLGVAYKRDTDDPRESPALEIIEELMEKGAHTNFSDPHFDGLAPGRRHEIELECVRLTAESVASYDAVLLVTDHTDFPYALVHGAAQLIVDSRNAFRQRGLVGPHIVRA